MTDRRQIILGALLLAGGCLAPHYTVDATDSVETGGSSSSGSSGRPSSSGSGQAEGGMEPLAGAANPGQGGETGEAGARSTEVCEADQKRCGGECVAISDVAYGCGTDTCNQSGCPADPEAKLGCEGQDCVAIDCTDGFKLCGSRCVSESDPTFGCGPTACDDAACPDPGAGTLTCVDGACVVGGCRNDSKKCGNKCVPKNEDNGCAAASCEACDSNEVCAGTSGECACVPNGDPCAGFECGSATDSCGEMKECRNECAGTSEPYCVGNTCRQCKADADCEAPANNPCVRAACSNNTCTLTTAAPNTPCPGGGKCSTTLPGVCDRPPVTVGTFDIDATEVTRGHYAAFLKAKGSSTSGQIAACSWNTTYTPDENWPGSQSYIDYPVASIDWCDAYAYCSWAGRRLCGKRGGGSAPFAVDHTGETAQWVHACMPTPGAPYPYGDDFDINACNGKQSSYAAARVASFPSCVGGVPGLYDMSGNVSEWEDSCDGYTDEDDSCGTQGGAFGIADTGSHLTCSLGQGYRRNVAAEWIGFRCCSNP